MPLVSRIEQSNSVRNIVNNFLPYRVILSFLDALSIDSVSSYTSLSCVTKLSVTQSSYGLLSHYPRLYLGQGPVTESPIYMLEPYDLWLGREVHCDLGVARSETLPSPYRIREVRLAYPSSVRYPLPLLG